MEIEISSSTHDTVDLDSIRVKRKTLQNLLDDCHRAPELLNLADTAPSGDRTETGASGKDFRNPVGSSESPSSDSGDPEADEDFSSRRSALFSSGFCKSDRDIRLLITEFACFLVTGDMFQTELELA
ncbi:hypothetical protein F2Q68_00040925 [Brassica cretica]|uniref:Uncharacterized protein n=1 Tax=Brassica cretica TaxID=69181 RepID=A0A8S9MN08_BRACR|nr:hypothetical protein F2Q68_00040925 [Brassica cretica]